MTKYFFIAIAALFILAASCGGSSAPINSEGQQPNAAEDMPEMAQTMPDEQFAKLIKEIYYNLPESVMCNELKTSEQRKNTPLNIWNDPERINDVNYLSYEQDYGEGTWIQWDMAGYVTDDRRNVVVIVRLYGAVHEVCETKFDKTLNYNIETGKITEIVRPIDAFTVDELIDETHFNTPELAAMAKAFFNSHKHPVNCFDFDRYGFTVNANLLGYAPYDDPWSEQNRVQAAHKWNGSRFVKGERWMIER